MSESDAIKERINYLRNSAFFSDIHQDTLMDIAGQLHEIQVSPGQLLFSKGDNADKMYIIVNGSYKIHDGDNVLNIMKEKGIFGEYAIIEKNKRTASVTSLTEGKLLVLSSDIFYNLLLTNVNITLAIIKSLISRIVSEKDKSEKLLQNILPYEIAEELKAKGYVDVQKIDMASVLFTDFSGFTPIAENMAPSELLEELNHCFTNFDRIISRYGLEKIKTIGDAYMCAGGVPVPNTTNPVDIAMAAIEIRDFMVSRHKQMTAQGKKYWQCRIGINTGSIMAGIVGVKKFAYDIWGDTVNTASRMESSGQPGEINITEETYNKIKDHFECSFRGEIQVKGKGVMKMYFVHHLKPECNKNSLFLKNIST